MVDEKPSEKKRKNNHSKDFSKKMKKNPWIPATFVLAVIVILILSTGFSFSHVPQKKASNDFIEFINSEGNAEIEYVSSKDFGSGLYEVTVESNGQQIPTHITKDGKYFVQIVTPITSIAVSDNTNTDTTPTTEPEPQDIPKSDKPEVELFVMSHCPFGTQAEKGILPVVDLLGDNIDFNIRFVYYAMHPSSGEVEEQLNQYCIQEEQEELYEEYLTCFLGTSGKPAEAEACREEVGVDEEMLSSCYSETDEEFDVLENLENKDLWMRDSNGNPSFPRFNIHKDLNEEYGVGGSPTLVINGQEASSGRAPASYLSVICSSFTEGNVPEECSESLSTTQYNPGFGWDESASASGTAAQCA
jgi:hypothetical protein